jgi:hypothetical protein
MASSIVLANNAGGYGSCTMGIKTDIVKPFKWEWRKNGKAIPGAENAPSYTTPGASASDTTSTYTCLVSGRDGVSEETAAVTMLTPAVVSQTLPNPVFLPQGHQDAIFDLVTSPRFVAALKAALK